ncbi:hypothetical protein HPB50_006617 [Hyalomma asiaticum]|uniref:Uncharacterized protein n=1 Tax=Hyalomma asiaticum TaxID=266040 RepID=A0ACB7S4N5_HYAAI|nr:hypothetical protein HPB50_006617 [Hyalomma asiaticum]
MQDFGAGASTRGSKLLPATARGYSEPLVPFHLKLFKGNRQELLPLLRKDKLIGSVVFGEAVIDDIRMNVALALTAARHGAVVANHVGCYRFLKDKAGRLRGVVLHNTLTGEKWPVRAKCVINATGHSADYLRQVDTQASNALGNPVLSTYMVLPFRVSAIGSYLLNPTDDSPKWQQGCLFGIFNPPPPHPRPLTIKQESMSTDMTAQNARTQVLSTWTSVTSVHESASGREKPVIEVSPSGMVSCTGSAWTWYRLVAERVVDTALAHCEDLQPSLPCSTKTIKLEGAANWSPTLYVQLLQKYRLEADVAKHLVDYYGDQATLLARLAANSRKSTRSVNPGHRLLPRLSFIEAEVRHAVRHEYACTAVDVLARRLGVTYADAYAAECMLPRVVDIMAVELGWTVAERERQMQQATRFLEENMGLALCRPHRHAPELRLDPNEFGRLVRLFQYLDQRQSGVVALRRLRPHILSEQFRPEPWLRVMMRRIVDIAIAVDSEAYLHNDYYVPPLYRSSVDSGSTKGTEAFTEKVEALSKALQLNSETLAEILDEMESATSGSMELGDFLLFMNNLKVCLRAQQTRAAKRDPSTTDLVELRGSDVFTSLPSAPTVYTI